VHCSDCESFYGQCVIKKLQNSWCVNNLFIVLCFYGYTETVNWLFENYKSKINVHLYNELALKLSCLNEQYETVKWLFNIGADINYNYELLLKLCCKRGMITMAKLLYDLGCDIHVLDEKIFKKCIDQYLYCYYAYGNGGGISMEIMEWFIFDLDYVEKFRKLYLENEINMDNCLRLSGLKKLLFEMDNNIKNKILKRQKHLFNGFLFGGS